MERPLRILHVVTHMGPSGGGVPIWLMHVMRRIDRSRYQFDFLVHTNETQSFDAEVTALGGRILRCPSPKQIWTYGSKFRDALMERGPYDVLHSHVLFTGHVMRHARKCGVPVRIAHSHSDRAGFRADGHSLHGAYLRWTNRWVNRDATHGLACSRTAAHALFGETRDTDARYQLLYYGIDLSLFGLRLDSNQVREELGLRSGELVVGHVGRFQPQKNHELLFRIFRLLKERLPTARLLLIGDGPLRDKLRLLAVALGIERSIVWAGVRPDVARLMRGAMDVLLLPSRYEGLPLVGIEAQAAGLPLVVSEAIDPDMDVIPQIKRVAVNADLSTWVEAVISAFEMTRPDPKASLEAVAARFDIALSIDNIAHFYDAAIAEVAGR